MWIFLCAAASAASIDPNLSSLGWGARGGAAQWSRFSPGVNLVIALRLARRTAANESWLGRRCKRRARLNYLITFCVCPSTCRKKRDGDTFKVPQYDALLSFGGFLILIQVASVSFLVQL